MRHLHVFKLTIGELLKCMQMYSKHTNTGEQ